MRSIKTANLNTTNRPCHWYAVTVGDDMDYGTGAYRKDVAFAMAREFASDNPETLVQVVLCTTDDDFCLRCWTVQEEDAHEEEFGEEWFLSSSNVLRQLMQQ